MKNIFILLFIFILFSCKQPSETIPPITKELFYDNVEFGVKDWVAESPWAIVGGYSYTLTHSWSDGSRNYPDDADYSLTSKSFDFTGYSNIRLNFWNAYWFEENYDFGIIEYSTDDSTWNEVLRVTGKNNYWHNIIVNLPTTNEATVKIRFRVLTDSTNHYSGWYIDEILIIGDVING